MAELGKETLESVDQAENQQNGEVPRSQSVANSVANKPQSVKDEEKKDDENKEGGDNGEGSSAENEKPKPPRTVNI